MKFRVQGKIYYSIVVDAESESEAYDKALEVEVGSGAWSLDERFVDDEGIENLED